MDILIVALLIAVVIIDILILLKTLSKKEENTTYLDKKEKKEIIGAFSSNVSIISAALQNSVDNSSKETKANLTNMSEKINENRKSTEEKFLSIEQ